jgi:hypothetical protein
MTEMSVVVQKAYDWNLWILPKVEKFPKSYRFSVGHNLVTTSLDLLMNLVRRHLSVEERQHAGVRGEKRESRPLPRSFVQRSPPH